MCCAGIPARVQRGKERMDATTAEGVLLTAGRLQKEFEAKLGVTLNPTEPFSVIRGLNRNGLRSCSDGELIQVYGGAVLETVVKVPARAVEHACSFGEKVAQAFIEEITGFITDVDNDFEKAKCTRILSFHPEAIDPLLLLLESSELEAVRRVLDILGPAALKQLHDRQAAIVQKYASIKDYFKQKVNLNDEDLRSYAVPGCLRNKRRKKKPTNKRKATHR